MIADIGGGIGTRTSALFSMLLQPHKKPASVNAQQTTISFRLDSDYPLYWAIRQSVSGESGSFW